MSNKTMREKIESYAKKKYNIEAEQLPFNKEDYAVFRHKDSGKWFAVFIVKSRKEFGLNGNGNAEIMSVKVRDGLLIDILAEQSGYLRGYPSPKWNWLSVVLDGTVPYEDICCLLDESYNATKTKARNQKVPLIKRSTIE